MTRRLPRLLFIWLTITGCGRSAPGIADAPQSSAAGTRTLTVRDTTVTAVFEAVGAAEAIQRATLSTRLMGNVTAVLVHEGDRVGAGATLLRLDAREISSKRAQVDAGIAAAEAVYRDAETQATRFRALYADSAATRYQLEQVETGLARAEAGLSTARASRNELDAVGSYADLKAPFAAVVTHRFVDPGAFAAPGAPLVELQDPSRLRVTVAIPAAVATTLRKGVSLEASVEGVAARATVEGVVPSGAGTVYTLNALIENRDGKLLAGSSATLAVPTGTRSAILVPRSAIVREGDLAGVRVKQGGAAQLRWVRLGAERETAVEVLSGLKAGDELLLGAD